MRCGIFTYQINMLNLIFKRHFYIINNEPLDVVVMVDETVILPQVLEGVLVKL
jgi:hypothetical protein